MQYFSPWKAYRETLGIGLSYTEEVKKIAGTYTWRNKK